MKLERGFKAWTIILLHLNGVALPPEYAAIRDRLAKILPVAFMMIYEISIYLNKMYLMKRSPKNMTPLAVTNINRF